MQASQFKAIKVGDETFYEQSEIIARLKVSRQTFYNWRHQERIPSGGRTRGRLVFTPAELEEILAFALRVEPADVGTAQLKLGLK